MRATVERSHLLKSLGHVHRVVERRNTIPILSNVLLRAESGEIPMELAEWWDAFANAGGEERESMLKPETREAPRKRRRPRRKPSNAKTAATQADEA